MIRYSLYTVFLVLAWFSWGGLSPFYELRHSGSPSVRVLVGGDVYLGDRIGDRDDRAASPLISDRLRSLIAQSDIHLANLEAPITRVQRSELDKQHLLRSSRGIALPVLRSLGLDGVSLANNHILDYGTEGLKDTLKHLSRAGIESAGADLTARQAEEAVFFRKGGYRVGFLAFSNTLPKQFWARSNRVGTAYGSWERVTRRVGDVSARSDFTVVSFHWGSELDTQPKDYQTQLAHQTVEAGADVVFGHHPHTLQPVEQYRKGVIFYSLGNYMFTTLSHNVRYGLLADVTLRPSRAPRVRYHLLNVNNYEVRYRPEVVESFDTLAELRRFLEGNPGAQSTTHRAG